jgi:uncharacterized protein (DUF927 family)
MQAQEEKQQLDIEQARQFIARLTGSADTAVTFQTFADTAKSKSADSAKYRERDQEREGRRLKKILHGTITEHAAALTHLNQRGAGVFVAVNETDLHGREADNIVRVRAVFADFDDAAAKPMEQIKALPLTPHIVVESSAGKAHAYWLVSDCALDDFKGMQQQIAKTLCSDRAINDLSRVMRLPGFIHQKGEPFPVRIVDTTDTFAYALADVRQGLLTPALRAAINSEPAKAKPAKVEKTRAHANEVEKIRSALKAIPALAWDDRETWISLGMALHAEGTRTGTQETYYALWCEYAAASAKYEEGESRSKWDSFSSKEKGRTIATLYKTAQVYGWQNPTATHATRFSIETDGVYYQGVNRNGEPLPPLRICGQLNITAESSDRDGGAWGLALEFEDRAGKPQVWVMPLGMLAGDAVEIRGELLSRGLWIAPGKTARDQLTRYLSGAEGLPRAIYTETPGWYEGAYVTPERTIGNQGGRRVLYQGGAASHFKQCGALDEWREHVCSLASGNSRLIFAISTAFAAPLLHMTGVDSGGFHFGGDSSQGKTSIVRAAASVWGGREFVQTWRATANGLEGVAQQRNDGLLVLDEMGQVDPKEVGEAAYMLANGRGKVRAGRTGAARPVAQWRLLYLSTGELGLAAHMNKAGQQVEAGQEIRLIEIPADAERGCGIYETLNGRADGAALSSELVNATKVYHGVVGVAFLEWLTKDYDKAAAEVRAMHEDYTVQLLPQGAEGQAKRAASRFALVAAAGQIATQLGLTSWPEGAALNAAGVCFKAWIECRGGPENAERRAILHQVRKWIEAHGTSRFQSWTEHATENRIFNRAGFMQQADGDGGGTFYFAFPSVFKDEICRGKDSRRAAKLLIAEGWLLPGSEGRSALSVALPSEGQKRCYVFTPRAMQKDIT